MLPVKFFIALIVIAVFGVAFVLLSSNLVPFSDIPDTASSISALEDADKPGKANADEPSSSTGESLEVPDASQPAGLLLLKSHCSKCHLTNEITQFERLRPDWVLTLDRMELFGVQLGEDERVILLDYLATGQIPSGAYPEPDREND